MTAIYLILIFSSGVGMTSQVIPQTNMQQCQVNVKNLGNKKTNGDWVTATCVVGSPRNM